MGFKVILTPESLDDLRDIVAFIAKDNPERGRIVPEIGEPTVREIIHGSYRIIYEIFAEQNAVYVLRFWHGARGDPKIKTNLGFDARNINQAVIASFSQLSFPHPHPSSF